VLERVRAHAHDDLAGPIRLHASTPGGWLALAVYPDGEVIELASRPAVTSRRARETPRRAPSAALAHVVRARQRTRRRAGCLLALLSVIAALTTVALSGDDPALPLSSQANHAAPRGTVTTSSRASSPGTILEHRASGIRTASGISGGRSNARRAQHTKANGTRPAKDARAHRPPAPLAPHGAPPSPLVLSRRPVPSSPIVPHKIARPPVASHRVVPPPPGIAFDDSG
jgi:hypothetical protein